MIQSILPYLQIVLSVILIALVLLQHSDAGAGAAFGGDSLNSVSHPKRGPEKFMFILTIIISLLFAVSAMVALII